MLAEAERVWRIPRQLSAASHNAPISEVKAAARRLARALRDLDAVGGEPWLSFWHEPAFGPDYHQYTRDTILAGIEAIEEAATFAMRRISSERPTKPTDHNRQNVTDIARDIFDQASPHPRTGTASSKFAQFARAFFEAVTGKQAADGGGLERQIRAAHKAKPTKTKSTAFWAE